MTSRLLPPAEWPKLAENALAAILPLMDQSDVQILVVEEGARIVASWAVLRIVHLEGVWIHEDYRHKVSVIRRLATATFEAARRWTPQWVMTGATDAYVRRLITKHLSGVIVPADQYIVPITGERVCRFSR